MTQKNPPNVRLPEFDQVQEVLTRARAYTEVSELHGLLCGFACFGLLSPEPSWLEILLAETPSEIFEQVDVFVKQLFSVCVQQLGNSEFDFQLLLPPSSDDLPLLEQLASLGTWCEGFLLGKQFAQANRLQTGQVKAKPTTAKRSKAGDKTRASEPTGSIEEALADIERTARIYLKAVNSKEKLTETMLYDYIEHVRIAVLLIYNELNTAAPSLKH